MGYEFLSPDNPSLWKTYHDIRRTILFEGRGRFGVYDTNQPDDFKANHFPKLLLLDKTPVGVIRIDIEGKTARFRGVAIAARQQRRGHGRVLLRLSEDFVLQHDLVKVEASVAADAVEFYRRCGYKALRVLDAAGSVRMAKTLGESE